MRNKIKFSSILFTGVILSAALSTAVLAAGKVKVGMITTLSGGGAGLGIGVRDGFMLAVKLSGNDNIEVVIKDDQRKPDIAVQLADKMIQSDKVDVLTGIIWSNLAMAVVPSATALGKFYLDDNRTPVEFEDLPENLVNALVATEDERYYEHSGIDWLQQ